MKSLHIKIFTALCLCGVYQFSITGQILQINNPSGNAAIRYTKTEWAVKLQSTWTDPYNDSDVALNMILITPSGKELLLPCYFESGKSGEPSDWKARFSPREKGTYNYHFELLKNNKVLHRSKIQTLTVKGSDKKGFLNLNNNWTFRYDNGELFRGIGENICWESRDDDDSKYFENLHENPKYNYDFMLKKLAQNGGNIFRTWMIYWNLPVDWKTVSNNRRYQNTSSRFNESGMKRLEKLEDLCDSLGIHMMLALESHAGFLGTGWELSNYNVLNGGPAKTALEFFTLPEAKAMYKNKLRLMVARFGYSPSIAAWEFFNEIDNVMYSGEPADRIPDQVITAWHDEMSQYLKKIDPYKHIITTSVSHRDVEGMNDLKNMDINQRHIYKNTDAIPVTLMKYSEIHNKPYIIGEFGYEWDWSKNFNDFGDKMDGDFRRGLWYGLFSPTPVLPMSWWWEFFENRGMMEYLRKVRKFSDTMLENCSGNFMNFEVTGGNGLQAFGVQSENKNYIFIYNNTANPGAIVITCQNLPDDRLIKTYQCGTGKYDTLEISKEGNTLKIDKVTISPDDGMVLYW